MDGSLTSPVEHIVPPSANDRPKWLRTYERVVWFFAGALIVVSIGMFMIGNTSRNVANLVAAQNTAALKLWVNLDYFEHQRPMDVTGDYAAATRIV